MYETTFKYIDDMCQHMFKMILNYMNISRLLLVRNDMKLKKGESNQTHDAMNENMLSTKQILGNENKGQDRQKVYKRTQYIASRIICNDAKLHTETSVSQQTSIAR